MIILRLLVRQQALYLCYVGGISKAFLTQMSQTLGGLLVQDVAATNMSALDLAGLCHLKALGRAAVSLNLRHSVFSSLMGLRHWSAV